MAAGSGTRCWTATRPRPGWARPAPGERTVSPDRSGPGRSCTRGRRAARCIPATDEPPGSSRRPGIRSAPSGASSVTSGPAIAALPGTAPGLSPCSPPATCRRCDGSHWPEAGPVRKPGTRPCGGPAIVISSQEARLAAADVIRSPLRRNGSLDQTFRYLTAPADLNQTPVMGCSSSPIGYHDRLARMRDPHGLHEIGLRSCAPLTCFGCVAVPRFRTGQTFELQT
jgi:hypothetical protein